MADLNIEIILDQLGKVVGKVSPGAGALEGFAFIQHLGSTPLDEADDTQGMRYFEWRDTGSFGVGPANTGAESGWYTTILELRVFYPKTLIVEGYPLTRGLAGIRLRDRVTLNNRLMYGDPLAGMANSIEYEHLQLVNASMVGKMMSLFYRLAWMEHI